MNNQQIVKDYKRCSVGERLCYDIVHRVLENVYGVQCQCSVHPDRLRRDEKHSANISFVKLGEGLIKPRSLFMFKFCHGPIDSQAEQFMQSLENI